MKTGTIQQEVLLVTDTTFSKRQWCENNVKNNRAVSHTEQLEEACWNGLLNEVLPEIIGRPAPGKRLYLWHIRKGQSSLHLEMAESELQIEKRFSLDPALFLSTIFFN